MEANIRQYMRKIRLLTASKRLASDVSRDVSHDVSLTQILKGLIT